MVIKRISHSIEIDGKLNEPVWESIEPLPLVSYEPVAGLPPTENTEVRIAYDSNHIYVSIRAYDSNSSQIRINSLYRDRLSGDDLFHILLDTYNDNESALAFTITPSGAKRDAAISNDGEGPNALNADFNTYWDVATQVDSRGWFAEVRIPFSSIGFQDQNGRVIMGLYVQRGISRKNERITFPEVPADIARAYFKPSLAHKIAFNDIYSQRPLHFTPYVTGGMNQKHLLNDQQTGFSRSDSHELDAGFDLKYGLTNNLTLDLTVNTDFAQAEADEQQVNLTRFNLFFPEKRQFFQERSGIFEFNTGNNGRLFHSRRIGLTESGEPLIILGGGRLTGRIGSWDIGVLSLQTDKYQDKPSENFGVFRIRRQVFNSYSYAGGMATSRIDADGSYNLAYGLDGSARLGGDDYLTWALAQSVAEETIDLSPMSTTRMRLFWERRTREGFAWQSSVSRSGEAYNPGIGFIPRLNYWHAGQVLNYGWIPDENSILQLHAVEVSGDIYWSATDYNLESIVAGPKWRATTKLGDQVNTEITWHYEDIREALPLLGRTAIPPGQYEFIRGVAGYRMASSRLLRTRIEADFGSFYGGWRFTSSLSPTWNISKHLELEGTYLYNLLSVPYEEDQFAVHLGQLKVRTALNTHLSTNAFVQFNSSAHTISTNIRFRYNFRDGNDLWIVYNKGMNTNRGRTDPMLPRTGARTVLVKYTHTFHW